MMVPGVNLLPAPRRERRRTRAVLRVWGVGLLLWSGALVGGWAALGLGPAREALGVARAAALREDLSRANAEVALLQPRADQARVSLARLRQELDTAEAIGRHPDWSVVLSLVSRRIDEPAVRGRLVLDAMQVRQERRPRTVLLAPAPGQTQRRSVIIQDEASVLTISGRATSVRAVNDFVLLLEMVQDSLPGREGRPFFDVVRMGEAAAPISGEGQGLATFMIECELLEPALTPASAVAAESQDGGAR